jgi:phosphocarrier protein
MPFITLIVQNKVGLHARPAAVFVQTAKQFNSDIKVIANGKTANAKSILNILTLGVFQGTEITIQAEGEDADNALAALKELAENNFGESE